MRVKVTYSVDLEDVPLKISSLLVEAHDNLKKCCDLTAKSSSLILSEDVSIKSVQEIKEARNLAIAVTEQLDDVEQIFTGYQKLLISIEESNQQALEPNYGEPEMQDFIDDLEQLKTKFKGDINNND